MDPEQDNVLLKIKGLSVFFGGLKALDNYSLRLEKSMILGVIGPNGAGKTTLFNAITGFVRPSEGVIQFEGQNIRDLKPHFIAKLGVARTFQNICLFGNLSVLENVVVSRQLRGNVNLFEVVLNLHSFRHHERKLKDEALELLTVFGLDKYKDQRAKNLAYGDQRRLEIARALATSPKLLLVDEPAAGMNPKETQDLLELILELKARFHLTIILIEHNMNLAMPLCERIQVLNYGQKVAEGSPEDIQQNQQVIDAYLGEREDVASQRS